MTLQKIISNDHFNKYATCSYSKRDFSMYYHIIQYNNINMLVLYLSFNSLHQMPYYHPYTFERYKEILFTPHTYLLSQIDENFEFSTTTELDPELHNIRIASSYTWTDENIPDLQKRFPEYTKEQLKEHEYRISVDNYLEILQKFLNFHESKMSYIILYEDDKSKVHCEEYFPTQEELNNRDLI